MWATSKRRTAIVKTLIDKGADVNARDNNGSTALMMAASNGYTDIVALLEAARAAIAKLFTAVKAKDASQVNEAIEAGARVNAKDVAGVDCSNVGCLERPQGHGSSPDRRRGGCERLE